MNIHILETVLFTVGSSWNKNKLWPLYVARLFTLQHQKYLSSADTCYVTTSTRDFHYDDGRVEVVQGDYVNLPYVKVNCTE